MLNNSVYAIHLQSRLNQPINTVQNFWEFRRFSDDIAMLRLELLE